MILVIDTADTIAIALFLVDGSIIKKKILSAPHRQTERLLPAINQFLDRHVVNYKQLTAIAAVVGPGPFTATRVGVATANGIGFAVHRPVIGVRRTEWSTPAELQTLIARRARTVKRHNLVQPLYSHEPTITTRINH